MVAASLSRSALQRCGCYGDTCTKTITIREPTDGKLLHLHIRKLVNRLNLAALTLCIFLRGSARVRAAGSCGSFLTELT
jgi:hypothetical protein